MEGSRGKRSVVNSAKPWAISGIDPVLYRKKIGLEHADSTDHMYEKVRKVWSQQNIVPYREEASLR